MPQNARKVIDNLFLEHPAIAGETYIQHLWFTVKAGSYLIVTSAALIFHGLVPRFHQTTASERLTQLLDIMKERSKAFEAGAGK